jgi:hypothetical protein
MGAHIVFLLPLLGILNCHLYKIETRFLSVILWNLWGRGHENKRGSIKDVAGEKGEIVKRE